MLEQLDDVIEELADQLYISTEAAHHGEEKCYQNGLDCRCCWTAHYKNRILRAIEVERWLRAKAYDQGNQ